MSSLFRLFTRRNSPLGKAPDQASVELIRRGNELEDSGQVESALELYRNAVQSSPQLADAHFNLGNALGLLGRASEAVTSYRRAVELQPDNTNAHLNLGATLLRCQSASAAEKSYRDALRLRPVTSATLNRAGGLCAREVQRAPLLAPSPQLQASEGRGGCSLEPATKAGACGTSCRLEDQPSECVIAAYACRSCRRHRRVRVGGPGLPTSARRIAGQAFRFQQSALDSELRAGTRSRRYPRRAPNVRRDDRTLRAARVYACPRTLGSAQ